jgi:DNA cross-link repair 1A protein
MPSLFCRYEAPYSEHCSFNELREFVRFINPVNIVPSVHNDLAEAADALVALLLTEEAE